MTVVDQNLGKCRCCGEKRVLVGWFGYCRECQDAINFFIKRRRQVLEDHKREAERQRILREQAEAQSVSLAPQG